MSDTFNPGPGWRELAPDEAVQGDWIQRYDKAANSYRTWVRESPVPPLPTARYTVIAVASERVENGEYILQGSEWLRVSNTSDGYTPQELAERITRYIVLSEPRAITAKAVLDRVRLLGDADADYAAGVVGVEFGVTHE